MFLYTVALVIRLLHHRFHRSQTTSPKGFYASNYIAAGISFRGLDLANLSFLTVRYLGRISWSHPFSKGWGVFYREVGRC